MLCIVLLFIGKPESPKLQTGTKQGEPWESSSEERRWTTGTKQHQRATVKPAFRDGADSEFFAVLPNFWDAEVCYRGYISTRPCIMFCKSQTIITEKQTKINKWIKNFNNWFNLLLNAFFVFTGHKTLTQR